MAKSIRNITFRVYPSTAKHSKLMAWLALHRELYNATLQERQDAYRNKGVSLSYNDQQNELPAVKKVRPDLIPLGSHALQETVRRVDRAYQAFFRRLKNGEEPGFPRFKGKYRFHSFTYPCPSGWKILEQKDGKGRLKITNLGILRMRGKPRVDLSSGERRTLTMRIKNGKWYATVGVRYPDTKLHRNSVYPQRMVGIDAGCKSLVATTDEDFIENPKHLIQIQSELKQAQQDLSRKKKGSRRWYKAKQKVARLHAQVSNRRKEIMHQLSASIVFLYPLIAVEDLDIKNMTQSAKGTKEKPGRKVKQKAGLNRLILDAGMGMFFQILRYKAAEAGSRYLEVAPEETTQQCFWCGKRVPKGLSDRHHQCPCCGFSEDRDYNASLNILYRGLVLTGWEPSEAWNRVASKVKRETTSMPCAA